MAFSTETTAFALVIQSALDTFDEPTTPDDLQPISNLRPTIDGITIENDEYTGSVIKNAAGVAGKRVGFQFNIKLRPPGGADVPSANAFLLGRILQAAKFTELRTTTAVPASAEAVSSGSTTGATLGAGATDTADLYKGLAIQLVALGSTLKAQTTAIRAYASGKVMTLVELLGGSLTGNYQIPKQLSYVRSVDSSEPEVLSMQFWFGGDRFDIVNGKVTGLRLVIPTSTKDQAAYPELEVTVEGDIDDYETEAAPSIPSFGAVPFFKNGKLWVAQKAVGAANFTLDCGITSESPPNPNKVDGSDAAVMVSSTQSISMTRQRYAKDVFDTLSMADAQANHAMLAQWGTTSGGMVQIVVPDFRFDYQSPDLGGNFVNEQGDLYIDALDRGVCINFPYGAVIS